VEKYPKIRQATDKNIILRSKYGLCMLDNYGKNTDTLAICDTLFFHGKQVNWKRFNVTLRVEAMARLVFACTYGLSVTGLMVVFLAHSYVIKNEAELLHVRECGEWMDHARVKREQFLVGRARVVVNNDSRSLLP